MAAEGEEVGGRGQRAVGRQLGGVEGHGNAALVGGVDDGVDGWEPAGDVRCRRYGQKGWASPCVQGGGDVFDGERAGGPALDVPAIGNPTPGQQVGVVLDHGGHHHVIGCEAQPVGQVVDGFGGVSAQHGHVVSVRVAAGEPEDGHSGVLVGGRGPTGAKAGTTVNARVPR